MNRFDRILGILLLLRGGKLVPAEELARRFEVSRRTIYRDMDVLSGLGVPVYAERGAEGGYQLLEGYFLPPLMFTSGEAISVILGLALWRSLHARPLLADLETAERKLLAVMPAALRAVLAEAQQIVGFEEQPVDIFHPETSGGRTQAGAVREAGSSDGGGVSHVAQHVMPLPAWKGIGQPVHRDWIKGRSSEGYGADSAHAPVSAMGGVFLSAIINRQRVRLKYRSYRGIEDESVSEPLGMFWDRGLWYLVGRDARREEGRRLWRADRLLAIEPVGQAAAARERFDVRELMGRRWLQAAMDEWGRGAPVRIRLTASQAERLGQDWYYRFAHFEPLVDGAVLMNFGDDNQALVFELLRWLGPGAELLEPAAWRTDFAAEVERMAATYREARKSDG